VRFPTLAGTNTLRDFVELPSQLHEHWLATPEVLTKFALHYETKQPIPAALVDKIQRAKTFNQGFKTVEYLSAAIYDMKIHTATAIDPDAFEAQLMAEIGMPPEIVMRHRPTHFAHIFSGGGYAAAYYSYMWSEVMDADAFAAFEETGDIFDPATAKKLHDNVYSSGGSRDPAELYTAFRGRLPTPDALLKRRGLVDSASA
jgi:peptidyl-dipeptidase Dcp